MYTESSRVTLSTGLGQLNFFDNVARNQGGGLHISNLFEDNDVVIHTNFINNTALQCGGAIYIETTGRILVHFTGMNIEKSSGSALCVLGGSIAFVGDTRIADNTGRRGGGIYSRSSSLYSQAIHYLATILASLEVLYFPCLEQDLYLMKQQFSPITPLTQMVEDSMQLEQTST